jgi:hypothetical protein
MALHIGSACECAPGDTLLPEERCECWVPAACFTQCCTIWLSALRILCSFRTGRQEDAHEYLIALLDAMHTMALGGPGVKVKPEEAAAKSLIYRIFAGKMRSTVQAI